MTGKLEQEIKNTKPLPVPQAVVLNALRTADVFQYRLSQFLKPYNLKQPQYNNLRILRCVGKPLPCLEIAARLLTRAPAITSLIDKLEKEGLVQRKRCDQDRRVWYVVLTDEGRSLIESLDEPIQDFFQELVEPLDDDERIALIDLLEKARGAVGPCEE